MDTKIIQPEDYKYFVKDPSSFNPAKNKAVINETIKETEKFFKDMVEKMDDEMGNRIDILSTYARYRFNTGSKNFRDYAGKQLADQLIGEKILQRVRVMDTVNKINGNDKFKKSILL
jgi:hypothetical protein